MPSTGASSDATAPVGNIPVPKKDRGHARKERRAAEAAAVLKASKSPLKTSEGSEDMEVDRSDVSEGLRGTVGAYVHISRISDQRVDHVERAYKPGQKVISLVF